MQAVCNASPLIALAKAGLLDILPKVFSRIVVPQKVVEGILAGPEDDAIRNQLNDLSWLEKITVDPPITPLAGVQLGRGEAEVIEWATGRTDTIALLDDRTARRAARSVGVTPCGTLGALRMAVRSGAVSSFTEAVKRLREAGLYLDEQTIEAVRLQLGE